MRLWVCEVYLDLFSFAAAAVVLQSINLPSSIELKQIEIDRYAYKMIHVLQPMATPQPSPSKHA